MYHLFLRIIPAAVQVLILVLAVVQIPAAVQVLVQVLEAVHTMKIGALIITIIILAIQILHTANTATPMTIRTSATTEIAVPDRVQVVVLVRIQAQAVTQVQDQVQEAVQVLIQVQVLEVTAAAP